MNIKNETDRFQKTFKFTQNIINKESSILDLGVDNNLSKYLKSKGYTIENTLGENLDDNYEIVKAEKFDIVTAFEIFEHMFCPYNLLKSIKAETLIVSVPLKLWFTGAYWNKTDERDRHYHEFEIKQFNFLLEKTGWKIVRSEIWKSANSILGIRPILRYFYPRYYIVHCERV